MTVLESNRDNFRPKNLPSKLIEISFVTKESSYRGRINPQSNPISWADPQQMKHTVINALISLTRPTPSALMIAAGENGAAASVVRESTIGLPAAKVIKLPRTIRKDTERAISIAMLFNSIHKMQMGHRYEYSATAEGRFIQPGSLISVPRSCETAVRRPLKAYVLRRKPTS